MAVAAQHFHVPGGVVGDGAVTESAEDVAGNHEVRVVFSGHLTHVFMKLGYRIPTKCQPLHPEWVPSLLREGNFVIIVSSIFRPPCCIRKILLQVANKIAPAVLAVAGLSRYLCHI